MKTYTVEQARKAKPGREQDMVKPALALLGAYGWLAWRNNSGAFAGEHKGRSRFVQFGGLPGAPDLYAVKRGQLVGFELKRPGKKPTEKQLACHAQLKEVGVPVYVVDDLEQMENDLLNLDSRLR